MPLTRCMVAWLQAGLFNSKDHMLCCVAVCARRNGGAVSLQLDSWPQWGAATLQF